MIELMPCPFCSGKPEMKWVGDKPWFHVSCTACGSRGPVHNAAHGADHEEAVTLWNQRKMADAAPDMLAALKRQHANIVHWLKTGEGASPEESREIFEQIHDAILKAEGHVR